MAHLYWIFPLNTVIFHSYIKLLEGTVTLNWSPLKRAVRLDLLLLPSRFGIPGGTGFLHAASGLDKLGKTLLVDRGTVARQLGLLSWEALAVCSFGLRAVLR